MKPLSRMPATLMERYLWFLLTLLCFAGSAVAQAGTANIAGMVEDSTNARVADAGVKLINTKTGTENDAITNKYGIFLLPEVIPGNYILRITKDGFATAQLTEIVLNIGDSKQFLIRMKVGPISETVTVDASGIPLNTSDASVSTEIDGSFAASLPLNGRSFQDLISATPGVVPLNPQSVNTSLGSQGEFSVNGQKTNSNYYMVDGIAANINPGFPIGIPQEATTGAIAAATALGTTQGLTSVDALQEFRVLSSTYSAEYGRTPGGQFTFVTKSGTNVPHGSLFDYVRNNSFDANDWFNNYYGLPKPALRQNDFGGTFGGPVLVPHFYNGRNKTFFFGNYEGFRLLQPVAGNLEYVPSLSLRASSPELSPVLNAFPRPTGPEIADGSGNPSGLAPFIAAYSLPGRVNSTSARLDEKLSSKVSLFFRYNETPSTAEFRQLSSLTKNTANTRTFTLGVTTQFSPAMSDDARVGYAHGRTLRSTVLDSFGGAIPVDLPDVLGDYGSALSKSGVNNTLISDLDDAYIRIPWVGDTNILTSHADNALFQWNWSDIFNVQTAHHTLKFGMDSRRLASPVDSAGVFVESSFYTRDAVASNLASNVSLTDTNFRRLIFHEWSAFAQDEWRAFPSLTLSMGLRWELNSPPWPDDSVGIMVLQGNLSSPSGLEVSDFGSSLWMASWRNFAPRLGVAWAPFRGTQRQTVLRAGAGVFFNNASEVAVNTFDSGIGATLSADFTDVPLPLTQAQSQSVFSQQANSFTNAPAYLISRHLQLPYTLQWNVSLEQALGESQSLTASYVGADGRRLIQEQSTNINALNPQFGYVDYYPAHLTSSYNALQVKLQRSLSHGVQALASYTWSHTLDYGSTDPLYPLTYGNSDQDVRHNFQAAFSWNMGKVAANGGIRRFLNGWGLDGRVIARSAFPITPFGNMHSTEFMGDRYYSGVDLIPHRPLYIYGPQYPGGKMLNGGPNVPNPAFVLPKSEDAGDAPRNVARGFGAFQVNLAVHRDFPIHERLHAEVRAGAFNLFNHPNFGYVDPHLTDAQFGQATKMLNESFNSVSPVYQQGGSRSVQLSVKLTF